MCHIAEYRRSHPLTAPPVAGAWVDMSANIGSGGVAVDDACASSEYGRSTLKSTADNCENWTTNTASNRWGRTVVPGGTAQPSCDTVLAVACCS